MSAIGLSGEKVPVLDSLRAFAALSVCWFHFVCTTTGFINNQAVLNAFGPGQYGVQLFFVISGFVLPWSMRKAGFKLKDIFTFLLKRLIRLEPPYLFSVMLAVSVLFFRQEFLGRTNDQMDVSVKQVLLHIGYLIPFFNEYKWLNQVYWTLAVEFQYYLLISMLLVPLVNSRLLKRILLYTLLLTASTFGSEKLILPWLPVFLIGIILFLYTIDHIKMNEFLIMLGVCTLICAIKFSLYSVIYSLIPVVIILYFPMLKIPILDYVGKFSYSLYLIHPIIGASIINALSHSCNTVIQKAILLIIGFACTIFGSWLTYYFIEKPFKRLSSSVKYKVVLNDSKKEIY